MERDVLVVDDSAAIRKILQRVLRQTGMAIRTIHEAGDGQEALEMLRIATVEPGAQRYQYAQNGRLAIAGCHEGRPANGATSRW